MITRHTAADILRIEVIIILCLCLTACTNWFAVVPYAPLPSPTPFEPAIIPSGTYPSAGVQAPLPTSPQADALPLITSRTFLPSVSSTISDTLVGNPSISSNAIIPAVAHPLPLKTPQVDTPALSIPPTFTPLATPTPIYTVTAAHIPIIEYHYSEYNDRDQVMMTTGWFENQMSWLADNGFTTLSADDLVSYMNGASFPQKSVILTFDLGTARKDNFINVIIPTLEKYKFTALFFILVNDSVVTDDCGNTVKFCWDDLRQWQENGIASIESHGISHPDYDTLTADQMRWDAEQAFGIISAKLGTAPLGFAYPYDSVPNQAPQVIQSIGYQFAVAGNSSSNHSVEVMDADRYSLPRVYPYSNATIYPIIIGSMGRTFDQMVMSYISGS